MICEACDTPSLAQTQVVEDAEQSPRSVNAAAYVSCGMSIPSTCDMRFPLHCDLQFEREKADAVAQGVAEARASLAQVHTAYSCKGRPGRPSKGILSVHLSFHAPLMSLCRSYCTLLN